MLPSLVHKDVYIAPQLYITPSEKGQLSLIGSAPRAFPRSSRTVSLLITEIND